MSCIISLRLCIILAACFIYLPLDAFAANEEKRYEWVLVQRHCQSGDFLVYIAPDAVKIVSLVNGGVALAKAPNWKVVCFHPADKTQWTTSLEEFQGISTIFGGSENSKARRNPRPLIQLGSGVDRGMNYSRWTDQIHNIFWFADEIKASPQVVDVISRYFSLPPTRKIPLRLEYIQHSKSANQPVRSSHAIKNVPWAIGTLTTFDSNSSIKVQFETKSCKKIAFNAAEFEYPKNFKQTNTINEVLIPAKQRDDVVDLINNLMFTSQPKASGAAGKQSAPGNK